MKTHQRHRRQTVRAKGRRPGLYDPRFEHDACGIGFVATLTGRPSREIVRQGLAVLRNLSHRGACGCDAATGDGAGILVQMPHGFLQNVCQAENISLPAPGLYASGLVFLPRESAERRSCMQALEDALVRDGQQLLGWRRVPVDNRALGELSRQMEPAIRQVFIGRGPSVADEQAFERRLYVIRKIAENRIRASRLAQRHMFHVPSLSSRTLVYKGMLQADQLPAYFPDLQDPGLASALAMVHQRYSTNTFPAWHLAQPFRFLCHNGEINTLRGNLSWLNARQQRFASELFGDDLAKLLPVAAENASDSAALDNMIELLHLSGRSLPHAIMMLIPEAWQHHATMSAAKKSFYAYHACLMEPWDGPAAVPFTDGRYIGAVLDRNGLRPSRYTLTTDGLLVMASETGVLDIPPANVRLKGRLQPGRMLLVDLAEGRIVGDEEIKDQIARRKPYGQWLAKHTIRLPVETAVESRPTGRSADGGIAPQTLRHAFGYTREDLNLLLEPMAVKGLEPTGSMGDDIPPAVLSRRPRLLYDYFKQLFAQVTNPPLDAIREALVTSLETPLGCEQNLLAETPAHCRQLVLDGPVLTEGQLHAVVEGKLPGLAVASLSTVYPVADGGDGLAETLENLCRQASRAVAAGAAVLILSDRSVDSKRAPIPALLAVSAVHHQLIREGSRTRCGIVVESAEPREVHHFCCLLGYGAGAVHPYLALATIEELAQRIDLDRAQAAANYIRAVYKGILKVMSKMGISTLQSYRGAQVFECIGLKPELVDRFFSGTSSRIGGTGWSGLSDEILERHRRAFPRRAKPSGETLATGGKYQWRRDGEAHQYNPLMLAAFRQAVFNEDRSAWETFSRLVREQDRLEGFIRGRMTFRRAGRRVPIGEVEPWTEIVKRFKTGAMSYGSISKEAHETIAVAMNRIGARSNSGEGGEDPDRYRPDPDGRWRNSAIKQVASGRFGVTAAYLVNARELQIKMAQGAKPGEGGQLPGFKVYPWIAATRHSTPYVGLISPPPHHDIYSIEDLAQLIHDLRCVNPAARISVKLVSEIGVGTVAAGAAKAGADVVLISGDSGGTGASPLSAIRHAGLPWELGLPETHQTLRLNGLRERIVVECDGQLKTGHDVALACLLGAEEFGFGTIALVALGCIMMRVCHLNTCPVGIATQDPELRKRFTGRPENVVTLMRFVAEEFREIMAELGFRSVAEMVGRSERIEVQPAADHLKAEGLDLSAILHRPAVPAGVSAACSEVPDRAPDTRVDRMLIEKVRAALETGRPTTVELEILNVQRSVGTRLSGEIARRYGEPGLPEDTITLRCKGSAGQSFCAFGARGLTAIVEGDANDYFGKGLSGACLVLRPPAGARFVPEENIIVGNVAFYGATAGEAFIRGMAGERFCVRNSGLHAVVEGTGDHACEYMTGGRVVILGSTGRNTAAGMSGGVAYVLDETGDFGQLLCNREMVDLEPLTDPQEITALQLLIERHLRLTGSGVARRVLDDWPGTLPAFVKIMPRDYKRALENTAAARPETARSAEA
jgi:glutamate synthase domain-containing protein 2/glutamate synthase domain-containing protein 1/glutamate synthase domain-containing protein 3